MPASIRVIAFLGYDPFPPSNSLSERLLHERQKRGWSIERAAHTIGVDASTWQRWERGELILHRKHRLVIAELLGSDPEELSEQMTVKWNACHRSRWQTRSFVAPRLGHQVGDRSRTLGYFSVSA